MDDRVRARLTEVVDLVRDEPIVVAEERRPHCSGNPVLARRSKEMETTFFIRSKEMEITFFIGCDLQWDMINTAR